MGHLARRIAILGSTGSIGTQTLSVVRSHPERFQVVGIGARRGSEAFLAQAEEFHPRLVALAEGEDLLRSERLGAFITPVSLDEMARHPDVDVVVVAIPGLAALAPALAALRAGKAVALASKEVLVVAGELAMVESARSAAPILPVDSEHNALWQCLVGEDRMTGVQRLVLTASGGPFRDHTRAEMGAVTPEQALAHPTWRMGPKVTVDSATLMNKAFEVMEAHWLFDMGYDRIGVIVHPQSIAHSLVEFVDGTLKVQFSNPNMTLPIQYALAYPERLSRPETLRPLSLTEMGALTFLDVDEERFPCFRLARQAAVAGGTYPAVLNAVDEEAVALFLDGRIPFLAIPALVEEALTRHQSMAHPSLEEVLAADAWARRMVLTMGTTRS